MSETRICCCGCGNPAAVFRNESGQNKGWRLYAKGHAPNESIEIRVPFDPCDLAYAAGIFDGEGCVYARVTVTKNGSVSTFLSFKIAMCSESVITWLHDKFGGEIYILQPKGTHKKPQFVWQIRGRKIIPVATALLPFLKEKYNRTELAIKLAELIKSNKYRPLISEDIQKREFIAATIKQFNRSGELAS